MLRRNAYAAALSFLVVSFLLPCSRRFASASAQQASFEVSGEVRDDADDQPVEGARVQFKMTSELVVFPVAFTSPTGVFRFTEVRSGEYYLLAEREGYSPARVRVIIAAHGDQVIIRMHRLTKAARTGPVEPTSVHQLGVPTSARDAFDKGVKLVGAKSDFRGGIAQFQRAIDIYPDYYEAYAQLGAAYDHAGDAALAEAALRKSVEMSSGKYAEPMYLLAELLNEREQFAEAEQVARRATDLEAAFWRGHFQLARGLAGLKRNVEAEASANKARELNPDNPDIYLLLSNLHMRSRNYPSLVKDLDAYLRLAPNGPASEQARKMRDQVKKALEAEQKQSVGAPPKL